MTTARRPWPAVLATFTVGALIVMVVPTALAAPALLHKELAVLTKHGISLRRASQALDVQSRVAQVDLLGKLQSAMGDAYAGAWFDNAAAQLDVGVTSPQSRRIAEGVAASVGLEGSVALIPVRSTMAQLLAVQEQSNRTLAHLFAREQVATGLEPQRNAVSITLSASVPATDRTAIKRLAATSGVDILVNVTKDPYLKVKTEACNNFPPANCDPSLTAGVSIERPNATISQGAGNSHRNTTLLDGFAPETLAQVLPGDVVEGPGIPNQTEVLAKPTSTSVTISNAATTDDHETVFTFLTGAVCTAGPAAIPLAHRTERVVLTAGHCVESGHGVGQGWFAFNRVGQGLLIGKAIEFQNGGAVGGKIGDYGDIQIEPTGGWETGNANDPVAAFTAKWLERRESRYSVIGERLAVPGETNCLEGQTSGEVCGLVLQLNRTLTINGRTREGLVQDAANGQGGDSGGPWLFVPATNNPHSDALMVGTHVGKINAESLYEPLRQPVAAAAKGSLEALHLELLTAFNEFISGGLPEFRRGEFEFEGTTGEVKLTVSGAPPIICSSGNMLGLKPENKKLGVLLLHLTRCLLLGSNCTSLGDQAGIILASVAWQLVRLLREVPLGHQTGIWLLVAPIHIACAFLQLAMDVQGKLCASIAPSLTLSSEYTVNLNVKEGRQEFTSLINDEDREASCGTLEGSLNHGQFRQATDESRNIKLTLLQFGKEGMGGELAQDGIQYR
jgi:hypothetical protein